MSGKYIIVCIGFSLWTIIQSGVRLFFIVYGYYLSLCAVVPSQAAPIFFYLTYFYQKRCKLPDLSESNETPFMSSVENFATKTLTNMLPQNATKSIEAIVLQLLNNSEAFPDVAPAHERSSYYFLAIIIVDVVWIVSAVALLFAACCEIKERMSLSFCAPWLICTVIVSSFDVAASVQFGLDLAETSSFANWLNFVGITNTTNLQDLDLKSPSALLPMTPTLSIIGFTSRGILVWTINLMGFFLVLKATTKFFKQTYKDEQRNKRLDSIRRDAPPGRSGFNLDTSASRIHNWNLYYGVAGPQSSSNTSRQSERDCNSNSKSQENSRESQDQSDVVPSVSGSLTYYAFPDIVDNIEGNNVCLNELRSQLPWSYTQIANDNRNRGRSQEDLSFRNKTSGNGRSRTVRIRSDSSDISVTEM